MLSTEDRFAIEDVINLHGHLTDRGDFANMPNLFTEDVAYDVSALGGGVLAGLAGARDAALELGEANPLAHHVTNIVLDEAADGTVQALSKYLGVMADGSVASGTYEDTLKLSDDGWRITRRVVRPRRVPLQP
ncbi:nuclear transport factor 2 family protein [Asanoa sp. NPDC049573]|uniref:nuclear transport factor 2 family protein n=1 Tax=Asanoa sp. NPDC049573 TaxID=3155396 RepID=UPI003434E40E